jgi:hypothetical protein
LVLVIGWAFVAKRSAAVWWQGLALTGAALFVTPVLATRWSDAGLFGAGPRLSAVVGVDVTLLVTALAAFAGAGTMRARC